LINRKTTLSTNLIAFCRYLRQNDFTIGLSEEQDALIAINLVNPFDSAENLELCLQATLCRTPYQLKQFPKLYQNYWRELDRAVDSKTTEKKEEKAQATKQSQKQPSLQALKSWLYGNKNTETLETATYSDGGFGNATEQVAFSTQEMKEVFQLVQKSIRKNIVRNGEIVDILYKKKKKDNIKVVLLCDVSRSMELYSRFFIQFMYAFHSLFPKVETFAFATALHHISKELNKTSINQSLQEVINKIPDWSGGTKIGASLQQFNDQFGHSYLTSKTLVIVLSDGWDTDEVDLVGENMKQIHRKALKVLWLNPLAGSNDWQPEVRGMKAALPYVDALLPFHNVESLREVVQGIRI